MSTRTTKVDLSGVGYFHYTSDLNIEPQIPKVKHSGEYYDLKTTKDENVELDPNTGNIVVVTNEVTTLKAKQKETENCYGAEALRQEVEKIAGLAKANKASLNGQVVIKSNESDVYRVLVVDNKVDVQEGKLAASWPDGTTSPLPKGDD